MMRVGWLLDGAMSFRSHSASRVIFTVLRAKSSSDKKADKAHIVLVKQ